MALLIGGLAVYPFFLVPTLIPGVILSLSALLYLLAALRREPTLSSDDLAKAREGRGEGGDCVHAASLARGMRRVKRTF